MVSLRTINFQWKYSRLIPIIGLICSAFVVASTTGDKWLVACVLVATASSDETTFAHVVTGVGLDEVPAVSQRYFFIRFQNNDRDCETIANRLRTLKSFLARCQALSADFTGDRIKNAAAGAAIV